MEDFWGPAQQMLADSNFLPSLRTYDKDNIPTATIVKIRVYLEDPSFNPEVVKKASKAAYGLCCWVRAMESYDRVAKVVLFFFCDPSSGNMSFSSIVVIYLSYDNCFCSLGGNAAKLMTSPTKLQDLVCGLL